MLRRFSFETQETISGERSYSHRSVCPAAPDPQKASSIPHRRGFRLPEGNLLLQKLKTLERQPLRVFDAREIKLADEAGNRYRLAAGQNNNGIDGDLLSVHGRSLSEWPATSQVSARIVKSL